MSRPNNTVTAVAGDGGEPEPCSMERRFGNPAEADPEALESDPQDVAY